MKSKKHYKKGVCVAAYGTDIFPAFFHRDSGCHVLKVESPDEVAKMLKAILDINLKTGIVLGSKYLNIVF